MIYFDNAATTAINKEVLGSFHELCEKYYGNPSSNHRYGQESFKLLQMAREQIRQVFKLDNYEVIFTSGATESNNIAIKGVCLAYQKRGKHIITSSVEHASVLNAFKQLKDEFGFEVTILPVNEKGQVEPETLAKNMRNDTILVSIMAVNNEVGSINDLEALSDIVHQYPKCFFHSDTTQALGKIDLPYDKLDMFVASAHKLHGLKGSGVLLIKKNITPLALFSGGGQESNLRSGTNDMPRDVAIAKTIRIALENREQNYLKVQKLNDYVRSKLKEIGEVEINSPVDASPFILNFSLKEHKASVIVEALSLEDIMVSTISACSSKRNEKSYVLVAMHKDMRISSNPIRLSFDATNTMEEVDIFMETFKKILAKTK